MRISLFRQRLGFSRRPDDAQAVAQPLHHGPGDEDRPFQRIGGQAGELIGDGGQHPVPALHHRRPGVHQGKTPRAIGRFHHAGLETGLPDRRRLLVARNPHDRDGRPEQRRVGLAEIGGAIAHLWQHRHGNVKEGADVGVPAPAADVVQHGARGVGGIGGMHRPAGQLPDQIAVDGAEPQLARFGLGPRPLDMGQEPFQLGRREIGVKQQAGLVADHVAMSRRLQRRAAFGSAAVLPDNRIMDRLAGLGIPDNRGFALVGDADGGNVAGLDPGLGDGLPHRRQNRSPDIAHIMLDPARAGESLRKFLLGRRDRHHPFVKQDRPAGGGALVDGKDMGHEGWPILGSDGFLIGKNIPAGGSGLADRPTVGKGAPLADARPRVRPGAAWFWWAGPSQPRPKCQFCQDFISSSYEMVSPCGFSFSTLATGAPGASSQICGSTSSFILGPSAP